jgi:hypothetical protein
MEKSEQEIETEKKLSVIKGINDEINRCECLITQVTLAKEQIQHIAIVTNVNGVIHSTGLPTGIENKFIEFLQSHSAELFEKAKQLMK